MRYPEGHKESVRARIIEAASRALRRDGLVGVSIPALMKDAGLTHGGFYKHFRDRNELVAEAVRFAAAETESLVLSEKAGSVENMLGAYLSEEHVRNPEGGCVLAALGTEAHRQDPTVEHTFAEVSCGFLRLVEAKLHPAGEPGEISEAALVLASRMIGAVVLARLVGDEVLAGRVLSAVRAATKD